MVNSIDISLSEAIEWYKNGNDDVKAIIALVFPERLLKINLESIEDHSNSKQFENIRKLGIYFNHGYWNKPIYNDGYFIACLDPIKISRHSNVTYPEITYFKNKADAQTAAEIIIDLQ
jgi:effector-binding domain-containing protein